MKRFATFDGHCCSIIREGRKEREERKSKINLTEMKRKQICRTKTERIKSNAWGRFEDFERVCVCVGGALVGCRQLEKIFLQINTGGKKEQLLRNNLTEVT